MEPDYKALGKKSARINIICDFLRKERMTVGEALEVLHDVEYALVQYAPIPTYKYSCFKNESPRIITGLTPWAAQSLKERNKDSDDGGGKSQLDK